MIDALDTAVVELDDQGRIQLVNTAAEACLGTARARAVGQPFEHVSRLPGDLRRALDSLRRDGRRRHVRECRMAGGQYDCTIQSLDRGHALLEFYDLGWEEQRRQLAQREVQTGMLDLLRRNLGHEIRNPLGGIRGAAQMMSEELGEGELGTLARMIIREVDRIDELIGRFGHDALKRSEVDLHRVCDEAIELLQAESGGLITVRRDFDPSIPPLMADGVALRQVLLNLVVNAQQANARRLVVRTRIEHGVTVLESGSSTALRIDVDDDGDGVPEHIRALLFLPLVTGRRDGTGLGLALSQQIAAAHGGLIAYQPLDQGSRFSVFLPVNGRGH
ncbi:MAG: ATP-binding protein [Xanthomonadales bacterium]|nr:ATP-binding protein [Xanthomonadales bacterium]